MSFKDVLNKNYAHTQNSVKKYEVGGKVVTKKGATNDAKKGGYFDGRPHSQGGIKAVNMDSDQPIEVEGGEVVITKRAVADDTKKEFQGKMMTNREILSKINESGGGVSFETGGQINQFADGGELTDDDFDFELDDSIFADGGVILNELEEQILRLIKNVNLTDDSITYDALKYVFVENKTPNPYTEAEFINAIQHLYILKFIDPFSGKNNYLITIEGKDYLADASSGLNTNENVAGLVAEFSGPLSDKEVKILDFVNLKNLQNEFADLEELQDAFVQKKTPFFDAFTKTDLKKVLKKLNGGIDGKNIYYLSYTKGYSGTRKKEYYGITQNGIDYLKNLSSSNTNISPSNTILEKYPFFTPDKVKETNPNIFALGRGSVPESQDAIRTARGEKEFYTSLLDDIPVTEVTERSEIARLINEQDEIVKFQFQTIQKEVLPSYALTKNGSIYIPTDIDDLIIRGRTLESYIESSDFRDISYIKLYQDFNRFLSFCVLNTTAFYKIWLDNFFGDWIHFSIMANYDAKILSDSLFYPANLSRVGTISNLSPSMNALNLIPYYTPKLMWQGLSKIYNKVGFDAFPVSYYAANYAYAEWFANTKGQQRGNSGVILPCMLKILRPLELAEFGIDKISPNIFFDSIYLQTGMTPEQLEVNPAFLSDSTPPMEVWVYIRNNPKMLIKLKESGLVDGIHMFENNPAVSNADSAYETEVWMTFFSEQTKVFPFTWWKDLGSGLDEDRALQTMSQFLSKGGKL